MNDLVRCTGFMDMETNTNPIDRSIAHLLFHRPSDPSVRSVYDDTSLKSHAMVIFDPNLKESCNLIWVSL